MGACQLSDLFDKAISRIGTSSLKYDGRERTFSDASVQPLWVADMDFAVPESVSKALKSRANHPIFGYTMAPNSLYEALVDWMREHHGWQVNPEWIVLTPGMVPSLNLAVMALTRENDGVIIQPPVYFPFFSAVNNTDRRLIENPLKLQMDAYGYPQYVIDFEHLEACAQVAKMLLLCSPHNPVGRVWQKTELVKLLAIAKLHNLIIFTDEIHADLVYSASKHHSLGTLADSSHRIITGVSPSKTFNIPGLGLSALIIPDEVIRKSIESHLNKIGVSVTNPFNMVAFETAYRKGGAWLSDLLVYLQATRDEAMTYIQKHLPQITVIPSQGTYLMWLDCRKLGLNDLALQRFFIQEAHLGLSPGTMFGEGGEGFMRMNIGTQRNNVLAALERLKLALR